MLDIPTAPALAPSVAPRLLDRLTDRRIAALKADPTRRYAVADGVVPGLSIRVTPSGHKTWTLSYRVGRRARRWTLGRHPGILVEHARRKAWRALGALSDGVDPAETKRAQRTAPTMRELVAAYLAHAKSQHKRSWGQDEQRLQRTVLPAWQHRAVGDVTRRDVQALLAPIVERGALVEANRVHAVVHTLLAFGVRESFCPFNAAANISKQPEQSRERVLTDDEVRALWAACEACIDGTATAIPPQIARGLQVQLLTAQRPGEVFTMRRADVDLETNVWTIPASVAKNGVTHRVPLVPEAVTILRAAIADGPADNTWVFAGVGIASVAERAVKAMPDLRRAGAITFDAHRHDLRRTAATGMAAAGVSRETIARVLNHTDRGPRVTAVYDRWQYDAEKRVALEAWGRRLERLLTPAPAATVLAFTG
jgi:integrase